MSEFPQALPDHRTKPGLRELLAKLRRDLSYAQSAVTDIGAALDALGVPDEIPRRNINGPTPRTVGQLEAMIRRGAITDAVDLDAEVDGSDIDASEYEGLRALLAQQTGQA